MCLDLIHDHFDVLLMCLCYLCSFAVQVDPALTDYVDESACNHFRIGVFLQRCRQGLAWAYPLYFSDNFRLRPDISCLAEPRQDNGAAGARRVRV